MEAGATKFRVEEAYWAASAEVLREIRAAARRLRAASPGANDNRQRPSEPDERLAG